MIQQENLNGELLTIPFDPSRFRFDEESAAAIISHEISEQVVKKEIANFCQERDMSLEKYRAQSSEFAEIIIGLTKEYKQWYENYYAQFDIDKKHMQWPNHILQIEAIVENKTTHARTDFDYILVQEHAIEAKSVEFFRLYLQALHLAHELYHSTAPSLIGFVEKQKIIRKKDGLHYSGAIGNEHSALEEGLAMMRQKQIDQEIIKPRFPEAAEVFETTREILGRDVSIQWFDGETVGYVSDSENEVYYHSEQLVLFLLKNIPNFLRLAERARILGRNEELELAQAVQEVFGDGSFRLIAGATDSTVADVLIELRAKISSNILH